VMALGLIAQIFEIVGAFLGCEGIKKLADCCANRVDGSRGSLSEQVLELGKELFDRVQVGGVFWQEEQLGVDRTDELTNGFALVAAEVVHDLAPKFYPILSSLRPLDLPGWAVVATGAGAPIERGGCEPHNLDLLALTASVRKHVPRRY